MKMCGDCGRVNSHHPHCPGADDIPRGFAQCDECGEVEETGFINDDGVCIDCEDRNYD